MSGQVKQNKPPFSIPTMAEIKAVLPNGLNVVSTFSGCGGSCLGFEMLGYEVLWASEFIHAAQDTYRANHPNTILDCRDIREVKAEEILSAIKKTKGQVDVLEGSPPCASFSTAGKREANWGKVKKYSDGTQRTDDLFFEYIRIVKGIMPRVLVAENVSGLVKGVAKGYFLEILKELRAAGYTVRAKVIDAQWLGVPQSRKRLIFIGIRNDLVEKYNLVPEYPKPLSYYYTVRDALPWICRGRYGKKGWRSAGLVSPTVSAQLAYDPWSSNQDLELVEAESDISRFAIGKEFDNLRIGEQSSKYFSLAKLHPEQVSPTITQGAANPSTAGIVHPYEKRKLSIAEVRRLCSFPDDFILTGTYSQRWERLGRSVPPLVMRAIAEVIQKKIFERINNYNLVRAEI